MILLRLISWPYVRKHLLRWLLTIAGIVLGVAVFVGMHTANQAVLYAFRQTVDRIAGTTQLQVTAGETGFDEDVLERVQAVPEVRVAVPVIEAVVNTGRPRAGQSADPGRRHDRRPQPARLRSGRAATTTMIDDPLVFLAQPDSLIVTDTFARENRLGLGAKVPMSTMDGEKLFTVRGIMKSGGLTSAFGGNLAIMDIYAAQKMFGRGRKFDRIDLAVKDGANVEDVQRASCRRCWGRVSRCKSRRRAASSSNRSRASIRMTANITSVVRAVHRDVHHLQHVPDRGDAAALGDRHSARAGRHAAADPHAVSGRERGGGIVRIGAWAAGGNRDRARHDRLHRRRCWARSTASRRRRTRSRPIRLC